MSQGRFRGVAPGCSLVVLKVLDRLGNGSIAHLCRSVDWLLANQYRYHIRVVNISLCSALGKLHPEDSPTHNCICKPDLIAPGARVISCHNGAKPYIARSGTSMSAPMVAGAIALCLEAHPEDTPKK